MKKVLVAMSGGVDSSVAAYCLKEQGYELLGVTMRLHDYGESFQEEENSCCTTRDMEDAGKVADMLGFPFEAADYKADFKEKVIRPFIQAYENCETPNPCVECNRYLKFEGLYRKAKESGCEYVATGHYARIEEKDGRYLLKRAKTLAKDQSYVLYSLNQEQLAHTLFPLGEYKKEETRQIAQEQGFLNAKKQDSQDICFIPDGDYAAFIQRTTGKEYPPGDFVDTKGNVLGTHKGLIHYTIGQRRGLGLALPAPLYVKELDPEKNQVILCSNEELFQREVTVGEINWIMRDSYKEPVRAMVKLRYAHKGGAATIYPEGDGAKIVFDEPQRAVTPGQSAVFYDGDYVIGGGKIIRK